MKLLRLKLKNLASFKKEVDINFAVPPFSGASLFAITGPTGAGKTTILDSISLALFNKTPRLESVNEKNPGNIIRQGEKEGFVELYFSAGGKEYIGKWHGKRKKGGKFARKLNFYDAKTEEVLVENNIEKIIGLDYKGFKLSVMLAQGEFARFLKSNEEEKRSIIEKATGLDLYERLKKILWERLKEVKKDFEYRDEDLKRFPAVSAEDITLLEKRLEKLKSSLENKTLEKQRLEGKREKEKYRSDSHKRLVDAQRKKKKLESERTNISRIKKDIRLADLAAKIDPLRKDVKKESDRLKSLEGDLKKYLDKMDITRKSSVESEKTWEKAALKLKEIEDKSEEQFIVLGHAKKEEDKASMKFEEAQKSKVKAEEFKKRKNTEEKNLKNLSIALKKNEGNIKTADETIAKNPVFDSVGYKEAGRILEVIKNKVSSAKEKEIEFAACEKKHKDILKTSKKALKDLEKSKKSLEDTLKLISSSQKKLDLIFIDGREDELEERVKHGLTLKEQASKFLEFKEEHKKKSAEITKKEKELEDTKLTIDKSKEEIIAAELKLFNAEKARDDAGRDKELAAAQNEINKLRSLLKDGSECPVCGAGEHPLKGKVETQREKTLADAEKKFKKLSSEFERISKNKINIENKQERSQEKKVFLENEVLNIRQTNDKTQSLMEKISEEWRRVYVDAEISPVWLSGEIQKMEDTLKEVRKLCQIIQQENIKESRLGQKVSGLEKEIENNVKAEKELKESFDLLKEKLGALGEDTNEANTLFYKYIPETLKDKTPELAMLAMDDVIKTVDAAKKTLEKERDLHSKIKERYLGVENDLKSLSAAYEENVNDFKINEAEGKKLVLMAQERTGGLKASEAEAELKSSIANARKLVEKVQNEREEKEKQLARDQTSVKELENTLSGQLNLFNSADKEYKSELVKFDFFTEEKHKEALRGSEWLKERVAEVLSYEKNIHAADNEIKGCESIFFKKAFSEQELPEIIDKLKLLEESINAVSVEIGEKSTEIKEVGKDIAERAGLEKSFKLAKEEKERWEILEGFIPKNTLRNFALKSMFDILLSYANKQLESMTNRYQLSSEDGHEIKMSLIDRWSAGEKRPVETLSGGESFLTSLSLALALSELSSGNAKLESLFLDEGFGTLDGDTLEIALCALEKLRLSGRTIGVISHISELTSRIPARIEVYKVGTGESEVRVCPSIAVINQELT